MRGITTVTGLVGAIVLSVTSVLWAQVPRVQYFDSLGNFVHEADLVVRHRVGTAERKLYHAKTGRPQSKKAGAVIPDSPIVSVQEFFTRIDDGRSEYAEYAYRLVFNAVMEFEPQRFSHIHTGAMGARETRSIQNQTVKAKRGALRPPPGVKFPGEGRGRFSFDMDYRLSRTDDWELRIPPKGFRGDYFKKDVRVSAPPFTFFPVDSCMADDDVEVAGEESEQIVRITYLLRYIHTPFVATVSIADTDIQGREAALWRDEFSGELFATIEVTKSEFQPIALYPWRIVTMQTDAGTITVDGLWHPAFLPACSEGGGGGTIKPIRSFLVLE